MKSPLVIVLLALLLAGCGPLQLYNSYQERSQAEQLIRQADAIALVTVGDDLPSYELGGRIVTDTQVTVVRGQNLEAGAKITLHRGGGKITIPDTGQVRMEIVSHTYVFPTKGKEAFLLLKRAGNKYEIIDAMALEGGKPVQDRPSDQVYLSYLSKLK